MWIPWAWAAAALLLAASGAAATLFRSSLLILGEEGLEEEAAAGEEHAAAILSAIRDPAVRHPFSLWVAAAALKVGSALCAGGAAFSFVGRGEAWKGPVFCAAWLLLYVLCLFFLENLSTRKALTDSRRVLRACGRLCLLALRAGAAPSRLLDRLGGLLFGARYSPEALMDIRFGSEEGILDIIEESAEHGTIDAAEGRMIEGVLRFGERDVGEVMTPWGDVVAFRQGMTSAEVASIAAGTGFSRYPVLSRSGEEVVGILSSRVLLRPDGAQGWEGLAEKPVYVPASMKVDDLLRRFQRARVHMAVVIDEHGKLCGVVTVHDLLEEIVGRLAEGTDTDEGPEWEKDGALSVPASTSVRVLRDQYGIQIPLGDTYETAAGFALDCLQDVPEGVVTFLAHGYRVTVAETERFRIKRLRFERTGASGTPGPPSGPSSGASA